MSVFTLFAVILLMAAKSAWRGRARVRAALWSLAGVLALSMGLLFGAISVGIRGYRAFTHEIVAATVTTEPLGPQRFRATVTLADSSLHMFDLAGDQVYVDAHVLKWLPIVTLLGL